MNTMLKDTQRFYRLILLLFTLTVMAPLLPCEIVNIHGLFGEIQSSAVASDFGEDVAEIASRVTARIRVKGANIFNIWLLIVAAVICLAFEMCIFKLPGEDTIVAKKVRMDN